MSKLLTIFILSMFLLSTGCSQKNDFDVICSYFDSLDNEPDINKMTSTERYTYINDLVTTLTSDSVAFVSWHAIVNLKKDKRYMMFTEAAEASIDNQWECATMKKQLAYFPD